MSTLVSRGAENMKIATAELRNGALDGDFDPVTLAHLKQHFPGFETNDEAKRNNSVYLIKSICGRVGCHPGGPERELEFIIGGEKKTRKERGRKENDE